MTVHCPFCQDAVEPNPNSIHCPDCGNPIPELRDRQEAAQPDAASPSAGAEATPTNEADPAAATPERPAQADDAASADPVDGADDDGDTGDDDLSCPSCGEPIEAEWAACPYCRTDLGALDEADDEAAPPETCPECGYEPIDADMAICPQCRTSLGGGVSEPDAADQPAHPAATGEATGDSEIVLDVDVGGTLTVEDGDSLGTELRQHLHDNGVSTQDAMRISRQHLLFKHSGGDAHVVDLESTNGTTLNGERLEPNREYPLSDGDTLDLADATEVTVHLQ